MSSAVPDRELTGGAVAKRRGQGRGGLDRNRSPETVPPVKRPPWEMRYVPLYFWVGGVAGGSWLAAALEDLAGAHDREVVRAGRYLAVSSTLVGSTLLILDLGRRERFLNMLRVVRPRSPMSLGSWALAAFGAVGGLGALLQTAEDAGAGVLARWSRGVPGRLVNLAGLPLALLVGSYTGVLIGATNVPSWGERWMLLGPLFVASSASSGLAAVSAAARLHGGVSDAATRRLARAEAIALATELGLSVAAHARARSTLPSAKRESPRMKAVRWLTLGAGIAAPLALKAAEGFGRRRARLPAGGPKRRAAKAGAARTLLAAGLALGGSLALRLLITQEGRRSADESEDTWAYTRTGARP